MTKPALILQEDIIRAIRAARKMGLPLVRIQLPLVTIEFPLKEPISTGMSLGHPPALEIPSEPEQPHSLV
jgi:hypothetical protein